MRRLLDTRAMKAEGGPTGGEKGNSQRGDGGNLQARHCFKAKWDTYGQKCYIETYYFECKLKIKRKLKDKKTCKGI